MLAQDGENPITQVDGLAAARDMGAVTYVECSPASEKKVKKVMTTALTSALKVRRQIRIKDNQDQKDRAKYHYQ